MTGAFASCHTVSQGYIFWGAHLRSPGSYYQDGYLFHDLAAYIPACIQPRLAQSGIDTEHPAHGLLGPPWILQIQRGGRLWQPFNDGLLADRPCLLWL